MEVYEDFTTDKRDNKDYLMIKKREFNPELSAFSNLLLDLVDFKDRVRPMAQDVALMDVSRQYQRTPISDVDKSRQDIKREFNALDNSDQSGQETIDEGYSSLEIQAQSTLEDDNADAAEPDMEAAAKENQEK